MIKINKNRAITLIALVVTIIILLILAGVTIATLTGENGILSQTEAAKTKSEMAEAEEKIKLAVMSAKMNIENISQIDTDILENEIKNSLGNDVVIVKMGENNGLPWKVTKNKYVYEILENGEVKQIAGISLSETSLKMVEGQDPVTLTATITEGIEGTITWTSSDSNIVTVNNGVITTVGGSGTATVTASVISNGITYNTQCIVTIISKVTNIEVADLEMEVYSKAQLEVETTPNSNIEDLIYTSSDDNVVSVDETGKVTGNAIGTATITVAGKVSTEVTGSCTVTVTKIVGAQVGDFVNYTAGNWTQTDLEKLGVTFDSEGNITDNGNYYSGASLPTTGYKFGGFKIGQSKDISITPYQSYANTYSGWRVLSLNEDGTIKTIVHAGTPEGYYHPYEVNGGYKSQYILCGTKNTDVTDDTIFNGLVTRDWTVYEDTIYAEQGKARLATYNEIYAISQTNNLRLTGSFYWLRASKNTSYEMWYMNNTGAAKCDNYNCCYGVRPVVTLKSKNKVEKADETHTTHTTPETAWNLKLN